MCCICTLKRPGSVWKAKNLFLCFRVQQLSNPIQDLQTQAACEYCSSVRFCGRRQFAFRHLTEFNNSNNESGQRSRTRCCTKYLKRLSFSVLTSTLCSTRILWKRIVDFFLIEVLLLLSGDTSSIKLVESFTLLCQTTTSLYMFPHSLALPEKQGVQFLLKCQQRNPEGWSTCKVRDDKLVPRELILVHWWTLFYLDRFLKN